MVSATIVDKGLLGFELAQRSLLLLPLHNRYLWKDDHAIYSQCKVGQTLLIIHMLCDEVLKKVSCDTDIFSFVSDMQVHYLCFNSHHLSELLAGPQFWLSHIYLIWASEFQS